MVAMVHIIAGLFAPQTRVGLLCTQWDDLLEMVTCHMGVS